MTADLQKIVEAISEAVVVASTSFREDQIEAYERAVRREENENARWALQLILDNARISQAKRRYPLCDDTGTPHLYVEVGREVSLPRGFFKALAEGVREGLRRLPARPMAVKGDKIERIAQSRGLYDDPGELVPTPPVIEEVEGDKVKVTVMMLGGGPELRSKTYRIYHLKSAERVFRETASWAVEQVAQLGCTPCVPCIGIGRTHYEATTLMLKAYKRGSFNQQDEWETRITEILNETGVGPLGLGGRTTCLGTFIEVGPQRASGARIVCMRLGCCYDPRRHTVVLNF